MKKMKSESFNLDHTKVAAPYIRLCTVTEGEHGDKVYKYDLRFKQPNKGYIEMDAMHSLEHLLSENIRGHLKNVIDIAPMGCQTGFYLLVLNNSSYNDIADALEKTLNDILNADQVPADNEIQCGGAARHNLAGAKKAAEEMLAGKDEWETVYAISPL